MRWLLPLVLVAAPAAAADMAAESRACADGFIDVSGTGQEVRATGTCLQVEVAGIGNTLHVTLAPGARVGLTGTNNRVLWTPANPKGRLPLVQNVGTGNTVAREP